MVKYLYILYELRLWTAVEIKHRRNYLGKLAYDCIFIK